jgi:hypothetical protein
MTALDALVAAGHRSVGALISAVLPMLGSSKQLSTQWQVQPSVEFRRHPVWSVFCINKREIAGEPGSS